MKYIGIDCDEQYEHVTMINAVAGEIKAKRLTQCPFPSNDCGYRTVYLVARLSSVAI